MSKPLIISALVFQIIGLVWDFIFQIQNKTVGKFFVGPRWPIYLGFVLLLVAVIQAYSKKKSAPNKSNPYLP